MADCEDYSGQIAALGTRDDELNTKATALDAKIDVLKKRQANLALLAEGKPACLCTETATFGFASDTWSASPPDANQAALKLFFENAKVSGVWLAGNVQAQGPGPVFADEVANVAGAIPSVVAPGLNELWDGGTLYRAASGMSENYDTRFYENQCTRLFVLNSDANESGQTPVDPDGNAIGEAQWDWFVDQVINSGATHNIAMFNNGFLNDSYDSVSDFNFQPVYDMQWWFESHGFKLILNGRSQINAHYKFGNLHILNLSAISHFSKRWSVVFDNGIGSTVEWHEQSDFGPGGADATPHAALITISELGITVAVYKLSTGAKVHEFTIS